MRRLAMYLMVPCLLAGCDSTSDSADPVSAGAGDPSAPGPAVVAMKDAVGAKDLGTLGGLYAYANGINNRTQVAGGADLGGDIGGHAFLWSPGRGMQDLGTLGGAGSEANEDPNERGDVVGLSEITGSTDLHAFLWTPGSGMQDLGTLGGTFSNAFGLNNRRQVVGFSFNEAGRNLPYLWEPGRGMRSLGGLAAPEDEADANGINDAGQIVGQVVIGGFANSTGSHPILWTSRNHFEDLGSLGGTRGSANAINKRGDVTGRSRDATDVTLAFLWTRHRGMEGLGSLGGPYSEGVAINEHRIIVGGSLDADDRILPFVWITGVGMRALPIGDIAGSEGGFASGINDRNEISGTVFTAETERAVLWRPRVDLLTASLSTEGELFSVEVQGPARARTSAPCRLGGRPVDRGMASRLMSHRPCSAQ